jgi:hypothetical protein
MSAPVEARLSAIADLIPRLVPDRAPDRHFEQGSLGKELWLMGRPWVM